MRVLVVLLGLLLVVGCSPAAPEPIWIGALAPLSGPDQPVGESATASMQLTLEKAREEDWTVVGRPVGVRHVDSVRMARAEAVRLLAVNHVAGLILGPGLANVEEVAAEGRTQGAAVVILDETATAPMGPAVRLLGPDPARRGRALAHLARTKLKKKRVAVLIDRRDALCAALGSAFAAAWRQGGELREWPVEKATGQPDLRADLAKYQPEVVLAAVPVGFLRDLAPVLPSVPILYGGPDVDEESLLRLTGQGKSGGDWYTAAVYTRTAELAGPEKEWRQRYEKSQNQPPGRSAVLARDGLRLMMAALEKARSGMRERLREELPTIEEFASVTGKVTWVNGMAVRPLFLVRLADGKPHLVEAMIGNEE